MIAASTTQRIRVNLGEAATTELPITGLYGAQKVANGGLSGLTVINTVTTDTTAVDNVVPVAAAGYVHVLRYLSIPNIDNVAHVVTLDHYNGTTARSIIVVTLAVGDIFTVGPDGWEVHDLNGKLKTSGGGGASAIDDLNDVSITAAATGDYLRFDGSNWVDVAIAQLLTDIKTVDGTASGLDADLLDGLSSAAFALVATAKPYVDLYPSGNEPPSAAYATPDLRNLHPTLDFDGATDEEAVWTFNLPTNYAGGGLTVDTYWAFTSATSGSLRVQAGIERIDASSLDIDADSIAAFQSAGGTAPGTSGQVIKVSVAFTAGAQMDSLAAGEAARLKIRRDADGTSGTDDITTDAELLLVVVRET